VFPVWSEKELGIGAGLLYAAIAKTSSLPVRRIEELVKETGDVGTAADKALANRKANFNFFLKKTFHKRRIFKIPDNCRS